MILGQDSKKLGKFLGQWNGKTETDSQTGQAIYKPDNKSQGPILTHSRQCWGRPTLVHSPSSVTSFEGKTDQKMTIHSF